VRERVLSRCGFFRLAAACGTLVIHFVLLALLLARPMLRAPEPRMAADETALQIVWIPGEVADRPVVADVETVAPAASGTPAPGRRTTVEPVDAGGPSGSSPPDPVSRPESTRRPLSLSPPPASMGFNDDPMSKGRATAMAQPDRLNLQLVDRSFGGTMQRMTKARTCGDLRAALRQHSGSTMTILRTMTRLGC